jgi:hypothetical protein
MAEIFIFNNMQKKIENIPKKNLKKWTLIFQKNIPLII